MTIPSEMSREEMLRLGPEKYLRGGFTDPSGKERPGLRGIYATAIATQLREGELSPQEAKTVLEAYKQTLPLHSGDPLQRAHSALEEAFELSGGLLQKQTNLRLMRWARGAVAYVSRDSDIDAFVNHFAAVVRQYGILVGMGAPNPSPGT